MAEVERAFDARGWLMYTVTSPKTKVSYTISKAENGYSQYKVSISKGEVPGELKGVYTTPDIGLQAILKYVGKLKKTPAVRRDERTKEREKRNGAKVNTDNSDDLQQGPSD